MLTWLHLHQSHIKISDVASGHNQKYCDFRVVPYKPSGRGDQSFLHLGHDHDVRSHHVSVCDTNLYVVGVVQASRVQGGSEAEDWGHEKLMEALLKEVLACASEGGPRTYAAALMKVCTLC